MENSANEDKQNSFAEKRVGATVSERWTLECLLGVGGTASVYSAVHRNGKRVAVKILHPELSSQEQFRNRFLREGYAGNAIGHPGAVAVHDDGVAQDGCAFLVMDLLQGENLDARRERKGGRLPPLEVLSLVDEVLDVLVASHRHSVVHRDIKPENLFLTTDNQVKLLDFGIARIDVPQDPGKTLAGIAMGTPAFMPPEQASARWDQVDEQSDIWAVGATMFTLLTGRFVHDGGTVNESLAMAVTRVAPLVESVIPALPSQLCEVVNRALRREKNERYADAEAMQVAVRQAYKELQDAPDGGDRYSLTHGAVALHSAPPAASAGVAMSDWQSTTGEPVSADYAIAQFRKRPVLRFWPMAVGAGLVLLLGFSILSRSSSERALANRADEQAKAQAAAQPLNLEPAVSPVHGRGAANDRDKGALGDALVVPDAGASQAAAQQVARERRRASPVRSGAKPRRYGKPRKPKPPEAEAPFDPFASRD